MAAKDKMNITDSQLKEMIEKKFGPDRESIQIHLATLKAKTAPSDGNNSNRAFSDELTKVLKIPESDQWSEVEKLKFSNVCLAIFKIYDIPTRPKQFDEFMAKLRDKARLLAENRFPVKYGKFIVPTLVANLCYDALEKGKNIWVAGPKGCGKTETAKLLFMIMQEQGLISSYETLDVYPDLTKMDLEGRDVISITKMCGRCGCRELEMKEGKGGLMDIECTHCHVLNHVEHSRETRWQDGILGRAARRGSSLLLNEIDAAGEDLQTGLMELLQEKKFTITQTGETFRCPDAKIMATANTNGQGSTAAYNRQQQDKALMDRFMIVNMGYLPEEREIEILEEVNPNLKGHKIAQQAVHFATKTREAFADNRFSDLISTRALCNFADMWNLNQRWDAAAAIKITLINIFPPDEQADVIALAEQTFTIPDFEKLPF